VLATDWPGHRPRLRHSLCARRKTAPAAWVPEHMEDGISVPPFLLAGKL